MRAGRGGDGERPRPDRRNEVEEVLEGDVRRRVSKVVQDLEDVPPRPIHVVVQICKCWLGVQLNSASHLMPLFPTLLTLSSVELQELLLFQNVFTKMRQHLEEVSPRN